ncbi:MAG: GNAT family N-acetyltransferase [Dehalobacterium sp.]
MEIKAYSEIDEMKLFDMLKEEGTEWESYYSDNGREKYKQALASCITYVAYEGDTLCAYVRCRDDNGFGVYVYDLLVRKPYRRQNIGRKLLEFVCTKFPEDIVYVMSDVDEYYQKQGYRREGSIFQVCIS